MILQTILKFAVIAALSPIWWPILKTLYREVELALLEEGGLLGRAPTPSELAAKRAKYGEYENPLVSEPWAHVRERKSGQSGKSAAPRPGRGVQASPKSSGPTIQKRAF